MHIRKSVLTVATLTLVMVAFGALAVDEHHPEQAGAPAQKSAPAKSGAAKDTPNPPAMDGGMAMGPMMGNMHKMQEQMAQLRQAKDPKERERLMQEQMKLMDQQMKMMEGMKGCPMMGK